MGAESDESLSQSTSRAIESARNDGQSCHIALINGVITTCLHHGDWQNKIHGNAGNMAMGDGSVQQHRQRLAPAPPACGGDNLNCVLKP